MLSSTLRILAALLLVYAAIAALAYAYQDRLAFPAPRRALPAPPDLGIADGERVTLVAGDSVHLSGWFLPAPGASAAQPAPAIIWFYGNMETVAALAPVISWLRPEGISVLAIDYRGYGESEGAPTEPGLYRDAEAAWAYVAGRPEVDSGRVGIYGRSLGSVVALYLATRRPIRAVALDSPFSNADEMRRLHYFLFPGFLLRHSLDNLLRARDLEAPLIVFHGTDDRIAPIRMGRAVAAAGHAREFVAIERSGHNDTYDRGGNAYREKLFAFWDAHLK